MLEVIAVRTLIAALALALLGSAAPAENAASEHKEKWDALRDRDTAGESDDQAPDDAEKAPREDTDRPQPQDESASTTE